jgi:co-chaperonin GroES (HSP10)
MKPTRDNIIVTRIAAEKTTASGLIVKSTGEPDKAVVESIGPKVDEVMVGDTVLLNWNKAIKVEFDTYVVPITEVIFIYGD